MAFPAPALEQDITDHGNVIIEPYGFSTVGAMGSGRIMDVSSGSR